MDLILVVVLGSFVVSCKMLLTLICYLRNAYRYFESFQVFVLVQVNGIVYFSEFPSKTVS